MRRHKIEKLILGHHLLGAIEPEYFRIGTVDKQRLEAAVDHDAFDGAYDQIAETILTFGECFLHALALGDFVGQRAGARLDDVLNSKIPKR